MLLLMDLSWNELVWQLLIALVLGGTLAYLFWKQRKEAKTAQEHRQQITTTKDEGPAATRQMQLSAYERLILLVDRIALPNLISRLNEPGLSSRDMQMVLVHNIKQEYEYNVTQQIYVAHEAWEAIRNLKDQNILIISQIGSYLPVEATGQDLNRAILEMLAQNPKATLHNVVADVLSFEARKLMQ
jgi:uncharacterized protein Yka (UPF0111/DUF47 family)